jgi:hypothetical protein
MGKEVRKRGALDTYLREVERVAIEAALDRNHGNVTAAAQELGRNRIGLYQRMRTLGIERPQFRPSITVPCPRCGVPAGERCRYPHAPQRRWPHAGRSVLSP